MKLMNVKIADIKENYNPRQDFSRVDAIAASIESMGLVLPIAVRETKQGLEVVDGHQRLAALKKLKQKDTQVIVLEIGDNAIESAMVVNLMRANLSMIEKARGFAYLMKERSKYNEKTISQVFGIKEADVKFLLQLADKLHPENDALFSKYVKMIDREDISFIMAVPADHQKRLYAVMEQRQEANVWAALHAIAYKLDFSDVFKFEQAKADKKIGFVIKKNGIDHVFTFDKKYHEDAVALFEKDQRGKYGAGELVREAKAEKVKKESAASKEKRRQAQSAAEKAVLRVLAAFVGRPAKSEEVHALGLEICEKGLSLEQARTILRSANINVDKLSSHELRAEVWEKIFWPVAKGNPQAVFRLGTLLRVPMKDGKTPAQVWIEFADKKK